MPKAGDSANGIINLHLNSSLPFRMNSRIVRTSLLYCHKITEEQVKLAKTQWLLLLSVTQDLAQSCPCPIALPSLQSAGQNAS